MLASTLLARTGATMLGLSIGFVAYEQTADAVLGGAGVLLMFGIGAGLISILRHDADKRPAAVAEAAKTPGG